MDYYNDLPVDPFQEHCDFTYSTDAEWDQYEARLEGERNPDEAWICSSRDAWYPNPFYSGPAVRHPEDIDDDEAAAPDSPAPKSDAPVFDNSDIPF